MVLSALCHEAEESTCVSKRRYFALRNTEFRMIADFNFYIRQISVKKLLSFILFLFVLFAVCLLDLIAVIVNLARLPRLVIKSRLLDLLEILFTVLCADREERDEMVAATVAQSVTMRLVATILVVTEEAVLVDGGLCAPDDRCRAEGEHLEEHDRRRHVVLLWGH